jgi:membrane fusion protein (multidrug efflux system)
MTKKKLLFAGAALAGAAMLTTFAFVYLGERRLLETTDDAYVKADSIVISPKISGYVAQVDVQDNQAVRTGMPLVRIEPSDYAARQEQLAAALRSQQAALVTSAHQQALQQSEIQQAEALVRAALAQQNKALADQARDTALLAKGFISKERADSSLALAEAGAANLANAQARLQAARHQLAVTSAKAVESRANVDQSAAVVKSGQLDLANTTVLAPRAGVVGNRMVTVGQYVKAGVQLMTIVPLEESYVVANFKETQIRRLRRGQAVKISVDADFSQSIDGVVDSVAPATGSEFSLLPPENATGNFTKIVQRVPVKIALRNSPELWNIVRPGMSVTVTVDTRPPSAPAARLSGTGAPPRF